MIVNDYRNTSYKNIVFEFKNKKIQFISEFLTHYPKAWHIYSYVNKRGERFNNEFKDIYYNKCIYCGVNLDVIESSNFEVDHYIPQNVLKYSPDRYDKRNIQGIDNLVNSCRFCNQSKKHFICNEQNLHPDENKLHEIFIRKNDFSIDIAPDYISNSDVVNFYKALKLDNEVRRINYLIMELKDFAEKHHDNQELQGVHRIILDIERKRRINY